MAGDESSYNDESGASSRTSISEDTPLLAAKPKQYGDEAEGAVCSHGEAKENEKIPKVQLALLCYVRMMEAIAYFVIFPLVNEMIYRTPDVKRTDTGFYAGLIEALFALAQMGTMPLWTSAATRFGRKLIIIVSLAGMGVSTALFGYSTAIWQMIILRVISGLFSGSAAAQRLLFYDISTPQTEARIFSFFPLANNFGMFIGPFIGGFLTDPTEQYPSTFGKIAFFRDYPYALATTVAGTIIASAAVTTCLFVKITRPREVDPKNYGKLSILELLKAPGVLSALLIWQMTILLALGFTAVLPTFWFNNVDKGGYGFPPVWISAFLATTGVAQALWTVFAYPPLERKIGRVQVTRVAYYMWPLFFIFGPLCNMLLRFDLKAVFWTVAPLGTVLLNFVSVCFSSTSLTVNDVAPSQHGLEMLNVIVVCCVSIARTVAPAIFTTLYAIGASRQILWGQFVWLIFIVFWIPPIIVVKFFPPIGRKSKV